MVEFLSNDRFNGNCLIALYFTQEVKSKSFGESCAICQTDFIESEDVKMLRCLHCYHINCI